MTLEDLFTWWRQNCSNDVMDWSWRHIDRIWWQNFSRWWSNNKSSMKSFAIIRHQNGWIVVWQFYHTYILLIHLLRLLRYQDQTELWVNSSLLQYFWCCLWDVDMTMDDALNFLSCLFSMTWRTMPHRTEGRLSPSAWVWKCYLTYLRLSLSCN